MVRMSFLNCSCNTSITCAHSMESLEPLLFLFQKKSKNSFQRSTSAKRNYKQGPLCLFPVHFPAGLEPQGRMTQVIGEASKKACY